MNAVSDLLAESGTRMDKERFNQCVLALNTALASGEDAKTADALRGLIPHFETLAAAAKEVLA